MGLAATAKEALSNIYVIRRHCLHSIQEADARGRPDDAQKYRDQLNLLNSLIESLGVGTDSWVAADRENPQMKLSARNQIPGTVIEVHVGAVNSTIKIDIGSGNILTSTVSNEAVEDLRLAMGDEVTAIIKAPDVMIDK